MGPTSIFVIPNILKKAADRPFLNASPVQHRTSMLPPWRQVFACQFHHRKRAEVGLAIQNFINLQPTRVDRCLPRRESSRAGCERRARCKAVNFVNLQDAGDLVEIAAAYDKAGADRRAAFWTSLPPRTTVRLVDMVRRWRRQCSSPLPRAEASARWRFPHMLLREGRTGTVNSAAIANPPDLGRPQAIPGRQCVVVAIDASGRAAGNIYSKPSGGGRNQQPAWVGQNKWTGWARDLTSMDCDDLTKAGYDNERPPRWRTVSVPVMPPARGRGRHI